MSSSKIKGSLPSEALFYSLSLININKDSMNLTRLIVKNFKSFDELDVRFNNFNVIIGSNASGKSNLLDVIRFLRDIEEHGLDSAISLQGGKKYFLNLALNSQVPFFVQAEIEYNSKQIRIIETNGKKIGVEVKKIEVLLEITFHKKGKGYRISKDQITLHLDVFDIRIEKKDKISKEKKTVSSKITLKAKNRSIVSKIEGQTALFKIDDLVPTLFLSQELPKNTPLLRLGVIPLFIGQERLFSQIPIYNFSSKLLKTSSPIIGKVTLEEDANNLPVVLKGILAERKSREKLVDLVNDLLRFVLDMRVTETGEKYLLLELKEKYANNTFLPSTLISDGTAQATAIIVSLYFGKEGITFFEEPEVYLHPSLVVKLASHMKEVSKKRQIIITTHNTDFLKNLELDEVLFISRNKEGFSDIQQLSEGEDVKHFLKNEIGIDELFATNLLNMN